MPTVIARAPGLRFVVASFGALTTIGYLGLLLAPTVSPLLWVCVLDRQLRLPHRDRAAARPHPLCRSPPASSGATQPVGYLLAAIGPILAGVLLDATGSAAVVLWFLAGTGVLFRDRGLPRWPPRSWTMSWPAERGPTGRPPSGAPGNSGRSRRAAADPVGSRP